jgi:hypothetical protein
MSSKETKSFSLLSKNRTPNLLPDRIPEINDDQVIEISWKKDQQQSKNNNSTIKQENQKQSQINEDQVISIEWKKN